MVRSLCLAFTSCILLGDAYRRKAGQAHLNNLDETFGSLCPVGLVANETDETCIYRGQMLDDPDQTLTSSWSGGSRHPIIFTAWGGLENLQRDFLKEMHFMLSEKVFLRSLTHMIAINRSHEELMHHGAHRSLEYLAASVERDSENLEPVEFATTQLLHHAIEEGLDLSLEYGLELAAGKAGLTAFLGGASGVLAIAGPALVVYETIELVHHLRHHQVTKDHHAREFAVALVAKSDCIRSKVALSHDQVFDNTGHIYKNFFIPDFDAVCGVDVGMALGDQMVKTNVAMLAMFEKLKGIGKCLFPTRPHSWSKSNCVNAIDDNLQSHEGEPGLLSQSFALAAAYGHESDQVLSKKMYEEWFSVYLNVSSPEFGSGTVQEDLSNLNKRNAPLAERAQSCLSIVGLHRAFERTFVRLKTALNVYMHSFTRDALHWSFRASAHPCRAVVKHFSDRASGMCMNGEDLPVMLSDSEWVQEHIASVTHLEVDEVGECVHDANPHLQLSVFNDGHVEGDEHSEHEEE